MTFTRTAPALFGLVLIIVLIRGSGASPYPMIFDCGAFGTAGKTPVGDATQRIELESDGISIRPPTGGQWCIERGPRNVTFHTSPMLGKVLAAAPSKTQRLHSFVVTLGVFTAPENVKLDTPADLVAVAEYWTQGGDRFTVRHRQLTLDASLGADCVRYDLVGEERNNPLAGGSVLIQVFRDNYICRHPRARIPTLVWFGASERYLQDTPQHELLIGLLRPQWEPSVRSVMFTTSR